MDILIVRIALRLRTFDFPVLDADIRYLLGDLEVEVEKSQFLNVIRVLGDFELMRRVLSELYNELENTYGAIAIHVCVVIR